MDERKEALKYLLRNFCFAMPFLVIGIYWFIPVSAKSIPAVFLLVVGAILLGKPIAALMTSSASSILFPGSAGREVSLMFSIPEARILERKFDEALSLFKEMIPRDPQRLEIYVRIMNLAVEKMKQPGIARDAFRAGLKNLTDSEDRRILVGQYQRLIDTFEIRN